MEWANHANKFPQSTAQNATATAAAATTTETFDVGHELDAVQLDHNFGRFISESRPTTESSVQ